MNLARLRAFHWVVITGSVSNAAGRLNLTQPAISRSIAALESELGFALFSRQHGRLVPTQQGKSFHLEAARILFNVEDLQGVIRDIRTNRGVPLRVVSMPQLARGLLPEAFATFASLHPDVRVSFDIRERRQFEHWIVGMQFDVGVTMLPVDLPTLITREFVSLSPVAIVPAGHRLAIREFVEIGDLVQEPMVILDPTSMLRHIVDGMFYTQGASPIVKVETSSAVAACELVGYGVGVSIVDPFTATNFGSNKVRAVPLRTTAQFTYGFVYSSEMSPSPVAVEFMDIVTTLAQAYLPAKPGGVRPRSDANTRRETSKRRGMGPKARRPRAS